MPNRIYYAIQQIGIKNSNIENFSPIHGLQNFTSPFGSNAIPLLSLGSESASGVLEEGKDVQCTCSKVLDGYPLIYSLATNNCSYVASGILQKADIILSIFNDNLLSATGTSLNTLLHSGMYITSIGYSFTATEKFTENVSFAGYDRLWDVAIFNGQFDGQDEPLDRINRRQDISFTGVNASVLPSNIPVGSHIVSINISIPINYDDIPSMGSLNPIYKIPSFPLEITTEISVNITGSDNLSTLVNESCVVSGFQKERILIKTCEGTTLNLGSGNKLISANHQGGGAGEGIVTCSYTYKTYESPNISHI